MRKLAALATCAAVLTTMSAGTAEAAPKPIPVPLPTCSSDTCKGIGQMLTDLPATSGAKNRHSEDSDWRPPFDWKDQLRQCLHFNAVSTIGPSNCERAKPTTKTPTTTQLKKVAAQLKLPNPTPRLGPDPSINEWNMLAVGFPIWLWTDQPTHITTTAHQDGLTYTLTATWTSTTFTMGDGHTKTCYATTTRPKQVKPVTKPSPTCGYTYQHTSKPKHPYTLTAHTHWQINWTTNNSHGTFTHTYTGHRTLEIGELQSLTNG